MQNKKLPTLKWMLRWNYWCKTQFPIEIYIDNWVSKPIFISILILDMQSTFFWIRSFFFFNKTCLDYKALIHQIIHINCLIIFSNINTMISEKKLQKQKKKFHLISTTGWILVRGWQLQEPTPTYPSYLSRTQASLATKSASQLACSLAQSLLAMFISAFTLSCSDSCDARGAAWASKSALISITATLMRCWIYSSNVSCLTVGERLRQRRTLLPISWNALSWSPVP